MDPNRAGCRRRGHTCAIISSGLASQKTTLVVAKDNLPYGVSIWTPPVSNGRSQVVFGPSTKAAQSLPEKPETPPQPLTLPPVWTLLEQFECRSRRTAQAGGTVAFACRYGLTGTKGTPKAPRRPNLFSTSKGLSTLCQAFTTAHDVPKSKMSQSQRAPRAF